MKTKFASKLIRPLRLRWAWTAAFAGLLFYCPATSFAQLTPPPSGGSHRLIDSRMAPGVASQRKLMGNRNLVNYVQPIRLVTPAGTTISTFANQSTVQSASSTAHFGIAAGLLYRFKLDFIANEQPRTLYPSIELLDRIYPPAGLENKFAVPIVLNEDDLAQASAGKMVTKVIYLENARSALPRRTKEIEQPYVDVGGIEDPMHVAESLGRPLAIVRIGSRVPTPEELHQASAFDSATPILLPPEATTAAQPPVPVSPTSLR